MQTETSLPRSDRIGPKTNLVSSDHPLDAVDRSEFITRAPVTIEVGAWLGGSVTALPGVTIGRDAVIGAGAVVAKDVPPNTLVTGPVAHRSSRAPTFPESRD